MDEDRIGKGCSMKAGNFEEIKTVCYISHRYIFAVTSDLFHYSSISTNYGSSCNSKRATIGNMQNSISRIGVNGNTCQRWN